MTRSIASTMLIGTLVFSAGVGRSQEVHAQLSTSPEILCTSHAREYCLAFLTYTAGFDATEDSGFARFSSVVALFGSSVGSGATGRFIVQTFVYGRTLSGTDCATGLNSVTAVSGPGLYEIRDASGGCSSVTEPARPPSPSDVSELVFQIGGGFASCSRLGDGNRCVSVPEPAPFILIFSFIVAMGLWGRRRPRDTGSGGE